MARRKKRASIASFLLAAASIKIAVVGSAGISATLLATATTWAQFPTAASSELPVASGLTQHNIAVQLRPTGDLENSPVITALAIDPRGELLAASGDDHVIRVLRRADFSLVSELHGHEDWVQSLDFSPDGSLLVSVANDGRLLTWDRNEGWSREVAMQDMPALRSVRFSPDGTMVATVGFSEQLFLMGIGNDKRPTLTCGCRDLRTLDFRGDGLVLAVAGRSGDVFLFDAVTGSTIADVKLSRRRIHELRFIGQTSKIVTASEDGHSIIFDTETRQVIHDLHIPSSKLTSICLIGSSHVAIGGSDNVIRVYDVETGQLVEQLNGHTGSVMSLRYMDNQLYSASYDTTVRRWNLSGVLTRAAVAEGKEETEPLIRTSRKP